jgi:hypothetical protein
MLSSRRILNLLIKQNWLKLKSTDPLLAIVWQVSQLTPFVIAVYESAIYDHFVR